MRCPNANFIIIVEIITNSCALLHLCGAAAARQRGAFREPLRALVLLALGSQRATVKECCVYPVNRPKIKPEVSNFSALLLLATEGVR
jgi:hypothetical protein